jgi:hypothetical protein
MVVDSYTTFAHNAVLLSSNDLIHINVKVGLLHAYTSLIQHKENKTVLRLNKFLSTKINSCRWNENTWFLVEACTILNESTSTEHTAVYFDTVKDMRSSQLIELKAMWWLELIQTIIINVWLII